MNSEGQKPASAKRIFSKDQEQRKLRNLAGLSVFEYEKVRADQASELGVRASVLDRLVKLKQQEVAGEEDQNELVNSIEPWDCHIDGAQLADEVQELFKRYVIADSEYHLAMTLWVIASYVFDAFRIFPKLCLFSPEKRCGKTTALSIVGALCHRTLMSSNISAAVIFRAVQAWKPTLVIDEGDTFLHGDSELRGIINCGHTKNAAFVWRIEEKSGQYAPVRFSVWSPMAIAMIKSPPETIRDRSVLISLRRKLPQEQTQKFPYDFESDCFDLRRKLKRWSIDHVDMLKLAETSVPSFGSDRAQDNWLPLIAVSNLLGVNWTENTVESMRKIETQNSDNDDAGIAVMLLSDIQKILSDRRTIPCNENAAFHSSSLVAKLIKLEGRPWGEWRHGRPLTTNSLCRMLRPFGIRSDQVFIKDINKNKNGYRINDFTDAFKRYLAPTSAHSLSQISNALNPNEDADSTELPNPNQPSPLEFHDRRKDRKDVLDRALEFQKPTAEEDTNGDK
jgi:hypothetical protein